MVSILIDSGAARAEHFQIEVVRVGDRDGDSDVSTKFQDRASRIQLKVNDNQAMGASYIDRLPGFQRVALSCGEPRRTSRVRSSVSFTRAQ